jgi:endo-1,4-beta-xylanase|tara:strand:+ start:1485 stop:2738 length:1254 start_codon:yes stop_codon:yes gene_type:complete
MRQLVQALIAILLLSLSSLSYAQCDGLIPNLRELADEGDLNLGFAVNNSDINNPDLLAILLANGNMVVPANALKFGPIHPERDVYNFSSADQIVALAQANSMTVRGHTLVWHLQAPAWLDPASGWLDRTPQWRERWTRDELIEVMRDHIHTVVTHYRENFPGVITQWDVVNEAFRADGSRRPTIWQQVIGDDYIELALRFAREADPDVKLYLNEFYDSSVSLGEFALGRDPTYENSLGASAVRSDCSDVPRCAAVRALATDFVQRGVPIDGIGFMGHHFVFNDDWPFPADYESLAGWTKSLGLSWALTEVDVGLRANAVGTPEQERDQGLRFRKMVRACTRAENCDTVVFWALTDAVHWQRDQGFWDGATLIRDNGEPKPAYWNVYGTLYRAFLSSTTSVPDQGLSAIYNEASKPTK